MATGVAILDCPLTLRKNGAIHTLDGTRMRGMRYAVDALLAGIGLTDSGKLKSDWISGSAHPTANVHARIAAMVRGRSRVETASKNGSLGAADRPPFPRAMSSAPAPSN